MPYRTPDDESGNYLIEIVCPAELVSIIIGAIEDQSQLDDWTEDGELTTEEATQLMTTVLSLTNIYPLQGGFLTDIYGNILTDLHGRLIFGGV